MNYVGIDWAYGRAAWCARSESGAIDGEGLIAADEDGLARLALKLGPEVRGCVEMMSGAIWVKDQLERAGWSVEVAHARKVRDIAPLACKTDKVDARVLAELCRRDLVPAVWVASQADRAIRERLRRRAHLVKSSDLGAKPDLRAAHAVRPASLVYPPATARCPGAARASRHAGGLARFGRRASGRDRRARPKDRPDRPRARPDRSLRPEGPAAADDPRRRAFDQPHLRLGDRRRLSLLIGVKARRLCRARSADQPVGSALGDRAAVEGRLAHAALGGGRGRQSGLATLEPLSRALPPAGGPTRKEPGEVLGRPQALDLLLAHALARSGLPTTRSTTAAANSSRFLAA